jgi:holo-[acyl-carrier protein] synthase
MIVGLGSDLIGVARIAAAYERHGQRFLSRIYTPLEQDYCLRAARPAERLAARWAAKEACMKALGTGWAKGVAFTDISLVAMGSPAGQERPELQLAGTARATAERLGARRWHCSVSHSDGLAIATVILEDGP